jgi:hypothetical protein
VPLAPLTRRHLTGLRGVAREVGDAARDADIGGVAEHLDLVVAVLVAVGPQHRLKALTALVHVDEELL